MVKIYIKNGYSILSIILSILVVVVAIGVWSISGASNISQQSSLKSDVLAISIINDGANIRDQYDRYLLEGAFGDNIIYKPNIASTSIAYNILDPVKGLSIPIVSKNSLRSDAVNPEGMWIYTNGYEDSYNADAAAVFITGINDNVCQSINKALFGTTTIPINDNYNSSSVIASIATTTNPNVSRLELSINFNTYPLFEHWQKGCFSASGTLNNNTYFQLMQRHS